MSQTKWVFAALLTGAGLTPMCWCQEAPSDLKARTLFYQEQKDNDQLPSVSAVKPQRGDKTGVNRPVSTVAHNEGGAKNQTAANGAAAGAPKSTTTPIADHRSVPVVQHLGLRYNLMRVDQNSGKILGPADPGRIFQPGDCLALELEANRSGYLYVFDKGSSGVWKPLLPSPEMPDEANIVRSQTPVQVPTNHCFEITSPPGAEQLFVVLSRNPEGVYDLDESIRNNKGSAETPSPQPDQTQPAVIAEKLLAPEIDRLKVSLQSRDLKITRIKQPMKAGEPEYSVYVANGSSVPSDPVVTEIEIQHR
jgi:hypothetical protein